MPPSIIAACGDSITWGCCCSVHQWGYCGANGLALDWPAVLQARLGSSHIVRNFGWSGATASDAAEESYRRTSFFRQALASNASTVLLMLGTNDARRAHWVSDDHFRASYIGLLRTFLAMPSVMRVIAITPPPFLPANGSNYTTNWPGSDSFWRSTLNGRVPSLVSQASQAVATSFFDLHSRFLATAQNCVTCPSPLYHDTIHPGEGGHSLIANELFGVLAQPPPAIPPSFTPPPPPPPWPLSSSCETWCNTASCAMPSSASSCGGCAFCAAPPPPEAITTNATCQLSVEQLAMDCACSYAWTPGSEEPTSVDLHCERGSLAR